MANIWSTAVMLPKLHTKADLLVICGTRAAESRDTANSVNHNGPKKNCFPISLARSNFPTPPQFTAKELPNWNMSFSIHPKRITALKLQFESCKVERLMNPR